MLFGLNVCIVNHVIPHVYETLLGGIYLIREGKESDSLQTASSVLSSQIAGYHGQEVDSKETVELIFPINVRTCYIN